MPKMRERECERAGYSRNSAGRQTSRGFLVAVYWMVVVAIQMALSYTTRTDHQNICTQKAKTKTKNEKCLCLPKLRV